jgi:hypothetical protein
LRDAVQHQEPADPAEIGWKSIDCPCDIELNVQSLIEWAGIEAHSAPIAVFRDHVGQ